MLGRSTLRLSTSNCVRDAGQQTVRHHRAMDPLGALGARGGAARREDLLANGVTRHSLDKAVAEGRVHRAGHGCYHLPAAATEVIAARAYRGRIACVTACAWWGLPMLASGHLPHLLLASERSVSRRGTRDASCVIHRSNRWTFDGLVAPPFVAIDQSAWCLSPLEQLVVVDGALGRGLVASHELRYLSIGDRARRAWLQRTAHAGAESPLETVARAALWAAGLRYQVQARPAASVGRSDFLVEGRLIVEVDGVAVHAKPKAVVEDRARDRTLLKAGLPTMRFTYGDVLGDFATFAADVAQVARRPVSSMMSRRVTWLTASPSDREHQ